MFCLLVSRSTEADRNVTLVDLIEVEISIVTRRLDLFLLKSCDSSL
jgi:hypothetical protein